MTQQQLNALIRQLGNLDPTNEPETTKQIGREAAAALSQLTRDVEECRNVLSDAKLFVELLRIHWQNWHDDPEQVAEAADCLAHIDATLTRLAGEEK